VAPVVVGIIGVIVEGTIIRFRIVRYDHTMLAPGAQSFSVWPDHGALRNTTVGSRFARSFQISLIAPADHTLFFVIASPTVTLAAIFAACVDSLLAGSAAATMSLIPILRQRWG